MPKALQKVSPHPPLGPTEHHAIPPTHVWDMRKRLGRKRDNLVHGAFLTPCRWSREAHCKGKAELMGGKKEPVMTIAEFSNLHTSFILTVCKL